MIILIQVLRILWLRHFSSPSAYDMVGTCTHARTCMFLKKYCRNLTTCHVYHQLLIINSFVPTQGRWFQLGSCPSEICQACIIVPASNLVNASIIIISYVETWAAPHAKSYVEVSIMQIIWKHFHQLIFIHTPEAAWTAIIDWSILITKHNSFRFNVQVCCWLPWG